MIVFESEIYRAIETLLKQNDKRLKIKEIELQIELAKTWKEAGFPTHAKRILERIKF